VKRLCAMLVLPMLLSAVAYGQKPVREKLKYCLPNASINASPLHSLEDPEELFYLLLITKSYISSSASAPGILEKWHFDASKNSLHGVVSPSAVWSDGRRVTSREAAAGIAVGLTHKPLGAKISVSGAEKLRTKNWKNLKGTGVSLLNDYEFVLSFDSSVANTVGILKDALSTNSRHNRTWPVKFDDRGSGIRELPDFVGKYKVVSVSPKSVVVRIGEREVNLQAGECSSGDFYAYDLPPGTHSEFSKSLPSSKLAVVGLLNPKNPAFDSMHERVAGAGWLRSAFEEEKSDGITFAGRHFDKTEAGFEKNVNWNLDPAAPKSKQLTISMGADWPSVHPIRTRLEALATVSGIKLIWIPWKDQDKDIDFDVKLATSRIQEGRHTWFQDVLEDPFYHSLVRKFPYTVGILEKVRDRAAATLPVESNLLQELERVTREETSFIPVARYTTALYSRKTSSLELVRSQDGEMGFQERVSSK